MGRDYRSSYPRLPPRHRRARSRGCMGHSFLCYFLCDLFGVHLLPFGAGLGGGQKGSLQRAATARTADVKTG